MYKIILIFAVALYLISGISGIPYAYCEKVSTAQFEYDSKGKTDPFLPLIKREKPKISGLIDITSVEDIRLEGIAMGAGGKNIAILNGQMVKENDKFGAICIKNISQKAVNISIEDRDYTLKLQEPEEGNKIGK